jgi:hypothetical protein
VTFAPPIIYLIDKYKTVYKGIKPVYSKIINEKIYFGMAGFNHLIFKSGHRRKNKIIFSRLVLVPLIVPVIKNCEELAKARTRNEDINGKKTSVTYYAFEAPVGKRAILVRVVIRKVGDKGKYSFQSVMRL